MIQEHQAVEVFGMKSRNTLTHFNSARGIRCEQALPSGNRSFVSDIAGV
jgi:hypothetical protein